MVLSYITWDVDPEIVNIFGISLRYYGIFFVGGLLTCIYVLKTVFQREGIPLEHLEKLAIYGALGVFIGARIGHCLFYEPVYYLTHIGEMLLPFSKMPDGSFKYVGYQGLASHGGGIGLITAIIIYSRKTKESALKTVDIMGIVAPLQGVFIRTANLLNSEIVGKQTDVPWAFIFEQSVYDGPRHPTQLYEAICYLVFFGFLLLMFRKKWAKFQTGIFFGTSITLIFVARFFIEFFKEIQVDYERNMTLDMGQILSIPFILTGISFIVWGIYRTNKGFVPVPTHQRSKRREKRRQKK
ncbi:MAG: prolipoprotein diacylglyceryl transferase [Marinilabiliaceae bacterium]|nr:prolipoprotein diacylglyceryl transferase [Marinilabiliaceae bacterium]